MTQLAIFSLLTLNLMKKYATEQEYMYNEILLPITDKQKIIGANEQSVYQFLIF